MSSNQSQQQLPRVSQEYVDRLIQKLQPPPGVSKQQRLQQLLAAGQLTRQDIAILKAHQARRNAVIAAQRAESGNHQQGQQVQQRSVPGKTVPGSSSSGMTAVTTSSVSSVRPQHVPIPPQPQSQQQPQRKPEPGSTNAMSKEQWDKLTPQQKQMYRFKQLRNQARVHKFLESDSDILKKYTNEPASLEFHIHDDYYRMGNTDNIISKNNPAMKDFLIYVAKGKLPDSLVEVIKDGGIRLYDGNIILQVFDHRVNLTQQTNGDSNPNSASSQGQPNDNEQNNNSVTSMNNSASNTLANSTLDIHNVEINTNNNNNNNNTNTSEQQQHVNSPKEYRTLLRMTQAAMYEDFSVSVDMKPVPDNFFLTYESEILTTMNRSLNLQPILNPFLVDKSLLPVDEIFEPKLNKETGQMEWPCRSDVRGDNLTPENFKYKPLHQDFTQSKSTYEKLMLIYSQSSQHSNLPASLNRMTMGNPIIGEAPRFERFRFIENYRAEQKQKREHFKKGIQDQPNLSNGGGGNYSSNNLPIQNGNMKQEPMMTGSNSPMMMDMKQQQQGKRIKRPTKRGMQTESPIEYDDLQQNKRRAINRRK